MGDGWKKITRRVKRLFGAKDESDNPRSLGASQIIRPEDAVPEHGKPAPPSTTRRARRPDPPEEGITITETRWGVVHVQFHNGMYEAMKRAVKKKPVEFDWDSVPVRDPVTRRLSRKKLTDGMKKTTGFYNDDGTLIDHQEDDW